MNDALIVGGGEAFGDLEAILEHLANRRIHRAIGAGRSDSLHTSRSASIGVGAIRFPRAAI
jgi:hypothetical protein